MPSEGLFAPIFTTPEAQAAVSDRSWLQAMLDVEAALARAEAAVGVIPIEAAERITEVCRAEDFDLDAIGAAAVDSGNPVVPLVKALGAAVAGDAAGWVHWGATSQDVLDTAAMLVMRRVLALIEADLERAVAGAAALSERHRGTLMTGRTLLQQATPVTFGLTAAGWLQGAGRARDGIDRVVAQSLAVQFGGATGTLASLGPDGLAVLGALAGELDLAEPAMPWHSARGRIVEVASAVAVLTGAMGKIAKDVVLLAQSEVAEVSEPSARGRGGSSAMPHKRNQVASVEVDVAARRAPALASVLLSAMVAEHERAAGAWQAEWQPLSELLALGAGAVARIADTLEGLEVDADRMRANLDAGGGVAVSEAVAMALAPALGAGPAHALVERCAREAAAHGGGFRAALLADAEVAAILSAPDIDRALDPANWIGSADAFIERALAAYPVRSR